MSVIAWISNWGRHRSKWTCRQLYKMRACSYQGRHGRDSWWHHQHTAAILANIFAIWVQISRLWETESRPVACFEHHIPSSVIGSSLVSCWSRKSSFWEMPPNPWYDNIAPLCCRNCLLSSYICESCMTLLVKHAFIPQRLESPLPQLFLASKSSYGPSPSQVPSTVWPCPFLVDIPFWAAHWYTPAHLYKL